MLLINLIEFDDLTEDEKSEQPNNGIGKEDANYLFITDGKKTISIHSDAMEPEDCTFRRDLKWIKDEILSAYELGKRDAKGG